MLGLLRVISAILCDERPGSELALASAMLAVGAGILLRVGALRQRIRVYLYRRR